MPALAGRNKGANLADYGNPVFERTALGNCGDTEPRGYSIVTADDLKAAVEVANACPGLERGVGVEVGELAALD